MRESRAAQDGALDGLAALELEMIDLHRRRELLVAVARAYGVEWDVIAGRIGVQPAEAEKRFGRIVGRLLSSVPVEQAVRAAATTARSTRSAAQRRRAQAS